MSTVKTISGDYTITVDNGVGLVTINGDLDVIGNITYVEEFNVSDPFIVIAGNNTGSTTKMGVVVQKTLSTFAGIQFDTGNGWQISSSVDVDGVGTYANIATGNASAAVSGSNTQIQFNNSGVFGATANLTFDTATNRLTIQGQQVLGNIGTTPIAVANAVITYNNTVGSGGTGLYVKSASVDDELVSKTKAIVFGIIF